MSGRQTYSRLAVGTGAVTDQAARSATFVLSDSSVARDGHVIKTGGWLLDNYKSNPVVLFAHDADQPPIGKMTTIRTSGDQLIGTMIFATADQNPFAETIYQLVKGGFLNAVSVSWDPIKWRYTADQDRPGGIDFLEQDLLEVSVVPVPALPTALATARSSGIDLLPLGHWADQQLSRGKTTMPAAHLEALRRAALPARLPAAAGSSVRGFKSLYENLMAILNTARGHKADERLIRSSDRQLSRTPSGLYEDDPTAGGFLVQDTFIPDLLGVMYEEAEIANRCDRLTTTKPLAGMKMPAIDESSRADGSRFGGALTYWLSEGMLVPASLPRFRRLEFAPHKLVSIIYGTDELHDDAPMFEAHIKRVFGAEMGFKLDAAILTGAGPGLPLGILNSPALITVPSQSGQSAATIVQANIDGMWSRLPAPSRKRAVWLVNEDAATQLDQLGTDAGDGPWYNSGGTNGSPWPLLKGRPVIAVEQCPVLGTPGDIVLADLSQYLIVDGGMKTDLSADVMFINDQVVWRFILRVDGKPIYATPITPFNGGATRSPFIALASR